MMIRRAVLLRVLVASLTLWGATGCDDAAEHPRGQPGAGSDRPPAGRAFPAPPTDPWFFRDLLATSPRPLPEARAEGTIWARLVDRAGRGVVDAEPVIRELAASEDPLALAQLRAGLDHADPDVRYLSCAVLGRRHDPRIAGILMASLRDERRDVALLALEGIVAQGAPWTMPRLIKCIGMHDNNPHLIVRVVAAVRLAELGNFSMIPLLIKVLKENTPIADDADREWERRDRIAWEKEVAIGAIGRLAGTDFGFRQDAPIPTQVEAIGRIETWWSSRAVDLWTTTPDWSDPDLLAVVERIIGALGTFQLRNIDNARYLLEHLGPPIGERLIEAATADDFYIRFHALEVLARLAGVTPEARRGDWARRLVDRLGDPEGAVRQQAALTVGALGGGALVETLAPSLQDRDPGVQRAAAVALGKTGSARIRRALQERLGAEDLASEVAVAITGALAATGDRQAAARFLAGLDSPDETVREGTRDTLVALVGDDFGLGRPGDDGSGGGGVRPDATEGRRRALQALLALAEH